MSAFMNTKMTEGTLVREHVLKMFDHLNTLEILELLSNSFNQFKHNYSMNKIYFTLFKLVNALQVAEGIIK